MARELMFVDGVTLASGVNALTCTVNVTPGFPDSADRTLAIFIESCDRLGTDNSIVSVTVGGVAATLQAHEFNLTDCALYTFRAPPKTTFAVVVTFNAAVDSRVGVYELEQNDPVLIGQLQHATGSAASSTLTLNPVDGANSMLLMGEGLFIANTTNTATAQAPFASDDSSLIGVSPTRSRDSIASCQNAGPSVQAKYTHAAVRAYTHIAAEFRGANPLPQALLTGMGM